MQTIHRRKHEEQKTTFTFPGAPTACSELTERTRHNARVHLRVACQLQEYRAIISLVRDAGIALGTGALDLGSLNSGQRSRC